MDELSDQIGERLQQAREKAGLTVDDVAFRTRIPRSVIVALEAADFSVFSSPTYAKSFLAQYSGFLNVEAALWLDALQPAYFISGETVNPLWTPATPRREEIRPEREGSSGWFSAVILLAVSCILVLAAIQGYEFFEAQAAKSEGAAKAPPPQPPPAIPPAPAAEPAPPKLNPEEDLAKPPPRAIIVR